MTELLTAAEMRAIEQAAIDSGQVTGLELMERAGRGVVDAIFAEWPELAKTSHKAVVLCGPGNNGGDGFVVARLMKDWGWEVEVFIYGDPEQLPPDAKTNFERWRETGEVLPLTDSAIETHDEDSPGTALAIDAIFGIGLSRRFDSLPVVQDTINYWWGRSDMPRVVSIDLPSGLCADSGTYLGYPIEMNPFDECCVAQLTVSFHAPKLGHVLADGPAACGRLRIVDIGLGDQRGAANTTDIPDRSCTIIAANFQSDDCIGPSFRKLPQDHKYSHGHALVLSGPMGRSGAARLAARAALRVGAGLVTVGAPGSAMMECACQLTAIMLRKIEDAEALALALEDTRINAICIGPGLGLDRARALVPVVLASARQAVLDADALTAYEDNPDALFAMLHPEVVLTPHAGEFARLFPDLAQKLRKPATKGPAYSKVDATRAAAERAGCTVLFKGADTVIASPNGRAAIHAAAYDRAAPWLATAGSGDVLAGLITSLMARGKPPQGAAEAAAWLHTEAAIAFGPGLIAEDLPEILPQILNRSAKTR